MQFLDWFDVPPYYETRYGAAYLGDSLELMQQIPNNSVNLVMTSPPFALKRQKDYGNVHAKDYIDWFLPFAEQMQRVITEDGSIVIDIGGTWIKGQPTRSLYHFKLAIELCETLGLYLAQEFYWYNPAKLPSPAEWVTVRRVRVKDAVNMVWWFSRSPFPKATNRNVLKPYSASMKKLLKNGYKAKKRPSGHDISGNFSKRNKGAIPPNMLELADIQVEDLPEALQGIVNEDALYEYLEEIDQSGNLIAMANTDSNSQYLQMCRDRGIKPHPARFPYGLPEFFTKFLTDEGDTVLDPFAGSVVTGDVAEGLRRNWIAIELEEEYLLTSKFRFPELASEVTGQMHLLND